jgi:hypothetical protein
MSALAWSAISPSSFHRLGFPVANFWWQLGACTSLALVALFCGWVQDRMHWTPEAVSFDAPEHVGDHGHAPVHGGHHGPTHQGHH